jgi:hypothetical protein
LPIRGLFRLVGVAIKEVRAYDFFDAGLVGGYLSKEAAHIFLYKSNRQVKHAAIFSFAISHPSSFEVSLAAHLASLVLPRLLSTLRTPTSGQLLLLPFALTGCHCQLSFLDLCFG